MYFLVDNYLSVGTLYYLSNIHQEISPIILDTVQQRKKMTIAEYITNHAPYRKQEACYGNGPTEIQFGGTNWRFYEHRWSHSKKYLVLIFRDGRRFKLARANDGKFNYGWRLATSTAVCLLFKKNLRHYFLKKWYFTGNISGRRKSSFRFLQ